MPWSFIGPYTNDFAVKDKVNDILLRASKSPSYSSSVVSEVKTIGTSILVAISVRFNVTLNSGVKYGTICSNIYKPSSIFLTIT